jgi:hypothetical protein
MSTRPTFTDIVQAAMAFHVAASARLQSKDAAELLRKIASFLIAWGHAAVLIKRLTRLPMVQAEIIKPAPRLTADEFAALSGLGLAIRRYVDSTDRCEAWYPYIPNEEVRDWILKHAHHIESTVRRSQRFRARGRSRLQTTQLEQSLTEAKLSLGDLILNADERQGYLDFLRTVYVARGEQFPAD